MKILQRFAEDGTPLPPSALDVPALIVPLTDAGRVLDADAAHPSPLRLTHDEAESVAIEADVLDAKHRGGFLSWVADVLHDIRSGRRDRNGRRR